MPEIRKATRADAQAAWDIRRLSVLAQCEGFYPGPLLEAWTSGVPSEKWAELVERGFYVAHDDATVLATGMVATETGRIDAIFVHPDHMGRGLGKQMMDFLEELARTHALPELSLDATLNAAPFYRRCGFVGETLSLHHSPRGFSLECVPMTKRLTACQP